MQLSSIPIKIAKLWANAAGSGFIRSIPVGSQQNTATPGAASFADGFPPATFLPIGSGGTPPAGQDFNGILQQLSAWAQWTAAAGIAPWDSSFSASIGGHPQGALVASATTSGLVWLNLVDNNTTNPDANTSANWISLLTSASGLTVVTTRLQQFAIIADQKANGVPGGIFTKGAWRTRDLNTVVADPQGLTAGGSPVIGLASNSITLQPGIYVVEGSCPALTGDTHKSRWQNITDGTTAIWGTSENTTGNVAQTPDSVQTRSQVIGTVTLTVAKTFQLQHICATTSTGDLAGTGNTGFGVPASYSGTPTADGIETYAVMKITKVG